MPSDATTRWLRCFHKLCLDLFPERFVANPYCVQGCPGSLLTRERERVRPVQRLTVCLQCAYSRCAYSVANPKQRIVFIGFYFEIRAMPSPATEIVVQERRLRVCEQYLWTELPVPLVEATSRLHVTGMLAGYTKANMLLTNWKVCWKVYRRTLLKSLLKSLLCKPSEQVKSKWIASEHYTTNESYLKCWPDLSHCGEPELAIRLLLFNRSVNCGEHWPIFHLLSCRLAKVID